MKSLKLMACLLVGLVSFPLVLNANTKAVAETLTEPTVNFSKFTPTQQAYLRELVTHVNSKLYLSRIRHQPESYVAVGEQVCLDMRQQGYASLVAQQTRVSGTNALQNQPMGNGSYRGNLQVQMGRTMLESARKYLCPDAPDRRP